MNIQELLQNWLISQYNEGKTDEELAEIAGCTRAHINRLRHGKFPMEKVKLETLLKLFPNLRIDIGDTSVTSERSAVNTGTNNGSMTVNNHQGADRSAALKAAIISALADSDMDAESIVKAIRIVKDAEPKGD